MSRCVMFVYLKTILITSACLVYSGLAEEASTVVGAWRDGNGGDPSLVIDWRSRTANLVKELTQLNDSKLEDFIEALIRLREKESLTQKTEVWVLDPNTKTKIEKAAKNYFDKETPVIEISERLYPKHEHKDWLILHEYMGLLKIELGTMSKSEAVYKKILDIRRFGKSLSEIDFSPDPESLSYAPNLPITSAVENSRLYFKHGVEIGIGMDFVHILSPEDQEEVNQGIKNNLPPSDARMRPWAKNNHSSCFLVNYGSKVYSNLARYYSLLEQNVKKLEQEIQTKHLTDAEKKEKAFAFIVANFSPDINSLIDYKVEDLNGMKTPIKIGPTEPFFVRGSYRRYLESKLSEKNDRFEEYQLAIKEQTFFNTDFFPYGTVAFPHLEVWEGQPGKNNGAIRTLTGMPRFHGLGIDGYSVHYEVAALNLIGAKSFLQLYCVRMNTTDTNKGHVSVRVPTFGDISSMITVSSPPKNGRAKINDSDDDGLKILESRLLPFNIK